MNHIVMPVSVTAVCEPAPTGQRLVAAVIEYDRVFRADELGADEFEVAGHSIVDVYFTEQPGNPSKVYSGKPGEKESRILEGQFVALLLEPVDLVHIVNPGPQGKMVRDTPVLSVRQMKALAEDCPEWEQAMTSDRDVDPVADQFIQKVFTSPRTGRTLPYNLFVPKDCGEDTRYPLVFYIHDAGAVSAETKMTLWQGIGATTWAEPAYQQEHPAIVAAPQYEGILDRDGDMDMVETTFDLVESIIEQYPVDPKRVYGTGQSLGTITEIEMSIRRPDFFTAMLLIAGQQDAQRMAVMKDCKMFIIVSRGDPRAYSGMNASLEVLEQHGAVVERTEWDQDGGVVPEDQVEELKARKSRISYAVLKTEERGFQCHMATWQVAYGIKGAKDWLFEQVKD